VRFVGDKVEPPVGPGDQPDAEKEPEPEPEMEPESELELGSEQEKELEVKPVPEAEPAPPGEVARAGADAAAAGGASLAEAAAVVSVAREAARGPGAPSLRLVGAGSATHSPWLEWSPGERARADDYVEYRRVLPAEPPIVAVGRGPLPLPAHLPTAEGGGSHGRFRPWLRKDGEWLQGRCAQGSVASSRCTHFAPDSLT
jgi:hypothetical protein